MIAADPLVHQAVAEFGRGLGLSALQLDDAGHAALRLQSGVVMHIALVDEELVLQIDCPLAFEGPELLERALVAANLRRGGGVQLGLRGRGAEQVLQVARRLPWRQGTAAALGRSFEQLIDWFEALRAAEDAKAPGGLGMGPGSIRP